MLYSTNISITMPQQSPSINTRKYWSMADEIELEQDLQTIAENTFCDFIQLLCSSYTLIFLLFIMIISILNFVGSTNTFEMKIL